MASRLKIAVAGATGYSGCELTRLLLRHPGVQPPVLFRREAEGSVGRKTQDLATLFPALAGNESLPVKPFSWGAVEQDGIELLFFATPHETSRALVPEAIARGLRVIDLSGAWRLRRPEHREVYGFVDADPVRAAVLTEKAVYGLPELHSDCIRKAKLVANPGCYATSVILALAPLLHAELVDRERGIVSDSKSGVSGAGKEATPKTHFVSVADNLSVYAPFRHRHVGEIVEQLGLQTEDLTFTPHLLPIPRGILSTVYVHLTHPAKTADIASCFTAFYSGKPWVRIFAAPMLPQIQFSLHTNYCDLGFCLDEATQRLIVVSCLDNLIKGAAGQAVQNMNLMYGWPEEEGLL
jgi:N-acetyl-gamma-glutamyl-phosphate reductase